MTPNAADPRDKSRGLRGGLGQAAHPALILLVIDLVAALVVIVSLVPLIAVEIRRLHDVNRSGWWLGASILYSLAIDAIITVDLVRAVKTHTVQPFFRAFLSGQHLGLIVGLVGAMALGITIFIFTVLPGTAGNNSYGPSPL
ncbi:MAG TPA: DUF805 domain-containing protein [Acidiferrobacter sp.]|nr:DUF805 domain-containing protein [Acidiferrobacter sp.]